ncbi:MAG: biotin carboxylase [Deltaproteobacteria bacterium]|nr:biotin carboxylase [Deltaproteobacteria bacterium]
MLDNKLQSRPIHLADSQWQRSYSLESIKCLIVCRGPVRKEAMEVFEEIGIREWGILLSEKDSIVYPRSLAPELRSMKFPQNVHRVPDYMGVGQEEKIARIGEIVEIATSNDYTHVFAGYGFMAEDAEFIEAIENAGLSFMGPSSRVCRRAGAKDEAKKLARGLGNHVIPGVDNISAQALVKKAGDRKALEKLAKKKALDFTFDGDLSFEENAETLLQAGYGATVELVTIEELQDLAGVLCAEMWAEYAGNRIRFKHIGGGGGKGQRVVSEPDAIGAAVMDVLAESKVVEPGSNRNFLIELNIETTRHNEIQLIGNGDWCISLGGRDCSVQMHEQKLIEVSLTRELLEEELEVHEGVARETLEGDMGCLERMEGEGERFGAAVDLDSVSTFECIVEGFNHFFMEMNTRIQVEHGVTELAYRLKFTNPDDPDDSFLVERLIEAMALLSLHGPRLPKPVRVMRNVSGVEVRINATNAALQPHAGGVIKRWSPPLEDEWRDDQGIGTHNPDTGAFVFYNLAGAYDSNIALLLTQGLSRGDNLERMAEILRRTELRGDDLHTNLPVHRGLISWMLGKSAMVKPNTRFMTSYLAAVGALQQVVADVDLDLAYAEILAQLPDPSAQQVFRMKQTLLLRPLRRLLASPHGLAGFIGLFDGELWRIEAGKVRFLQNPMRFLQELYHYLNLEDHPDKPPCEIIWGHDENIMEDSMMFYGKVAERTGAREWHEVEKLFEAESSDALAGGDPALWQRCVAAHRGFQVGLELLLLIPRLGVESGFTEISVGENLEPAFPEKFTDAESVAELTRALAPAPKASSDEIVTPVGGAFYSREAPHLPILVDEGDHFEAGQPLFIIEVMKMFNKVLAPFAGTVTANLMKDSDGQIVHKGQVIFKIEPDERIVEESDDEIASRRRKVTLGLLQ